MSPDSTGPAESAAAVRAVLHVLGCAGEVALSRIVLRAAIMALKAQAAALERDLKALETPGNSAAAHRLQSVHDALVIKAGLCEMGGAAQAGLREIKP
jgi:hypothetical protein